MTDSSNVVSYLLGLTGLALRDIFERYQVPVEEQEHILRVAGDAMRVTAKPRKNGHD